MLDGKVPVQSRIEEGLAPGGAEACGRSLAR
jgi:hypothetical protein